MKIEDLRDKKIALAGLGIEGKATLLFLKHFFPDKKIDVLPEDLSGQEAYELIIRSPGIEKKRITAPSTTATNIFFANVASPVIGITGSKGKSTTAALVHAIFARAGRDVELAGNIGRPMLEALLAALVEKRTPLYIVELSSYQLDDIKYSPHVAVILNLFPDHMDYHGGLANYWLAKQNIVKFGTKEDYYVYNPAYTELADLAKNTSMQGMPFIEKLPFADSVIPLLGTHNRDNVCAAVTIANIFKIDSAVIESAVREFKPLPHRLEYIGTHKGILFYDDAISTTPESTIAAIDTLENIGTILLGGKDRGYDFSKLVEKLATNKIPNLVFFPDGGSKIRAGLEALGSEYSPRILETKDMQEAIKFAYAHTPAGMICLLSCASPSYTLWKNFEEKGNAFQDAILTFEK